MKILDLPVEKRDKLGSSHARRYRQQGQIPCVLYGGGEESLSLRTTTDAFEAIIKGHTALVRLTLGDVAQTALVRDVTWNTFGDHIEHIDFVRVRMEEEVRVTVPIVFKGIPAGVSQGGEVQKPITDMPLFSRVDAIPSDIVVDISALEIHDGIHVSEVSFPEHVRPALPETVLVVQVVPPRKIEELLAPEGEPPVEGEVPEEGEAAEEGEEKKPDSDEEKS